MHTAKKLLKALQNKFKKNNQTSTIYAIAKRLEVSRQTCHKWEQGGRMDDENAIKIALFLDLDPKEVLLSIQAERAKGSDSYEIWKAIMKDFETKKRDEIAA